MKSLPKSYSKNGYQFNLVERKGDFAIYSQLDEGKIYAYEIFEIQKNKERIIAGKTIEAGESCPSNEQWGMKGWTYSNLPAAYAKMQECQNRVDVRKMAVMG